MAGLHHPVPAHCSGPGAAGQRWKRNALLPDTGAVHSFQLLYLHHDLHIYGAVFHCLLVLDEEMHWEKFVGRGFQFAVYSLLSGGLAAVVLLPEIFALQMTASGDMSFPKTFSQYFPIFDMIARHIGNVETEIGLDHWPNVYCGVAVLMFFILYLLCKRVPAKEKAVYCAMLIFFFASFSFNILNFIWHGFHYPNSLPCRQSYIYIFPGAVCLLSGLHVSAGDTMEACDGGVCRSGSLCAVSAETGDRGSFPLYRVLCCNPVSGVVSGGHCSVSERRTLLLPGIILRAGGCFY